MSWISSIKAIFGGGIVDSIETIALEAIQTDMEKAEAKALFVKTLDPNGKMRRDLSRFTCKAYGFYLISTVSLITVHSFALVDAAQSMQAMEAIKDLFVPITTAFATIVSASFGVNATNSIKSN